MTSFSLYYNSLVEVTERPSEAARYKYGDPVETRLRHGGFRSARPLTATAGLLGVPQASAGGRCSRTEPVRFLQDSFSRCVVPLTKDTCSAAGQLSARLYAASPRRGTAEVGVLVQPDRGTAASSATTDVNFACVTSAELERHSRAVTSDNALHRGYSLFVAGCPPGCPPPPPTGHTPYVVPLWRSAVDVFTD